MDVREHPAVGTMQRPTAEQLKPGYEAQGFALAQSIIAESVSTAKTLSRIAIRCFEVSQQAREHMLKTLNRWKKDCAAAAVANANLEKAGMSEKDRRAIASSATTRVREFNAIVKAMDAGMTLSTLGKLAKVPDPTNLGFHTIVKVSRLFKGADARGRPADPFFVKLLKWMDRQDSEADAADKAKLVAALKGMLPAPKPAAK